MQFARVLLVAVLLLGCSNREFPTRTTSVVIDANAAVAEIDERFLSVAVDSAQVVGGSFWSPNGQAELEGEYRVAPYDFERSRLRRMAVELAPAYLRIGGTAADRVYYDLSDQPEGAAPEPFENVMTRDMVDGIHSCAAELGFDVMFTLAAGPGPRDPDTGAWTADNARPLVDYAADIGMPVALWELGNELNAFPLLHGIDINPAQYAADAKTARTMLDEAAPTAKLAAPSSAYWPVAGELGGVNREFLAAGGGEHVDVVTWHYYPQQSQRCLVATRRAGSGVMLDPDNLSEVDRWAADVESARDAFAVGKPVWLGESGSAQCGGQPGLSDTFESTFWWLDQLGRMAARGQQVVVRQTLSGSDYGLIDDDTLVPRPDYFASILWRRLMGPRVLRIVASGDPMVRAYAHCAAGRPGAVSVLLLNLDGEQGVQVDLRGIAGRNVAQYEASAMSLDSGEIALNGAALAVGPDGSPPDLTPRPRIGRSVVVGPQRWAFATVADANAAACL